MSCHIQGEEFAHVTLSQTTFHSGWGGGGAQSGGGCKEGRRNEENHQDLKADKFGGARNNI